MLTMDRLLEDIGGLGKFQMLVIFCVLSTIAATGWSIMQMSFSGIIPDWYCIIKTPNQSDNVNPSIVINYGDDQPLVPIDYAFVINISREVCSVDNATCDSFRFENSPLTIINQWDLVCDLSWVEQAVTSIQMVGILVGAFISSQLGDRFGRKKLLYGSLLEHTLINVIAGFSVSWEMFAVCRFFIGVGIGCHWAILLPYCLEFFPSKWCNVLLMIPAYQIGVSIFALVAFLLKNWAHVHFALAIFNTPFLLGWAFFPESPRWLAVHGRIDEALEVLSKIAKINGKPVPRRAIRAVIFFSEAERFLGEVKNYSLLDLFRPWRSARTTVFLCFIWFALNVFYYRISVSVSSIWGDVYLNIVLMAVTDIPMILIVLSLVNKTGRRPAMVATTALITIAAIGCIAATTIGGVNNILITVLAIIVKMTASSASNLVMLWSSELYPTVTRGTAYALFNMSGCFGGIISPYVVNLDGMALVSYVIITSLSGICVFLSLGVPETKGNSLADTLNAGIYTGFGEKEEINLHTSVKQQREINYGLTDGGSLRHKLSIY